MQTWTWILVFIAALAGLAMLDYRENGTVEARNWRAGPWDRVAIYRER